METQRIWNSFNEKLYFFILKRVKDKHTANDIFQETFLKIHKNLSKLKQKDKVKAWVYQIARNEIANYFNKESVYLEKCYETHENIAQLSSYQHICCFDAFINALPKSYRQVVELVYIKGLKQQEVAEQLNISLANVKARIRRAKELLKHKFNTCCKYDIDKNGKLSGDSDCTICS